MGQDVTDIHKEPPDATPLTPSERDGLKLAWVSTRSDLNQAEHDNILKAMNWASRLRSKNPVTLLNAEFACQLHHRMFGDVWTWAGAYRMSERNLGIFPHRIAEEVAQMFDDVAYWVEHKSFGSDETCIRLHHRLVYIHPFANGNGRHSRLMADLLSERLSNTRFSWGGETLINASELRSSYIAALKVADNNNIQPLLLFARS